MPSYGKEWAPSGMADLSGRVSPPATGRRRTTAARTRAAGHDPATDISNAFPSLGERGSLDQLAAGPDAMSDQPQRISDLEPKPRKIALARTMRTDTDGNTSADPGIMLAPA